MSKDKGNIFEKIISAALSDRKSTLFGRIFLLLMSISTFVFLYETLIMGGLDNSLAIFLSSLGRVFWTISICWAFGVFFLTFVPTFIIDFLYHIFYYIIKGSFRKSWYKIYGIYSQVLIFLYCLYIVICTRKKT